MCVFFMHFIQLSKCCFFCCLLLIKYQYQYSVYDLQHKPRSIISHLPQFVATGKKSVFTKSATQPFLRLLVDYNGDMYLASQTVTAGGRQGEANAPGASRGGAERACGNFFATRNIQKLCEEAGMCTEGQIMSVEQCTFYKLHGLTI